MKCSICFGSIRKSIIITPCNHAFHLDCIKKVKRPFCPLCKRNITRLLLRLGVSMYEIKKRIQEDDKRIEEEANEMYLDAEESDENEESSDSDYSP